VDAAKLRSWWFTRQGLDGSLEGKPAGEALLRAGWARSVGGSNPYLSIFARTRSGRQAIDEAAAKLDLQELPSARGCTYVVPRAHYPLAMKIGQASAKDQEFSLANKHFGVTESEIANLCAEVLKALEKGKLDPATLKKALGDKVRAFGEEGKKKGLTSTLPIALGKLQNSGQIRRVPVDGRLDHQRYAYVPWDASPLEGVPFTLEEALVDLAKLYFSWIGPATKENFRWFTGLAAGKAEGVLRQVDLVDVGEGMLLLKRHRDEFERHVTPADPCYALVAGIDSLFLLRRDIASHLDAADVERQVMGERALRQVGHLVDLPSHAIVDRGRLIGLWEYDPEEKRIVYQVWTQENPALRHAIESMEAFVRDELGDARSFSLDSPKSRRPRIEALRGSRSLPT
jgi:hypothetical protein